MTEAFDPYHKWLGIPLGRRPPNHYEMLGIALYESDLDVIENAADRRMSHIKTFASGPQAKISQLLLNQLSEARVCLCSDQSRKAYDLQLQKQLAATGGSAGGSVAGTSSSRRARSGGSGLWLGLSMLAASLIVCYLAFTHGWAAISNLQAANDLQPESKALSDSKTSQNEDDSPKTNGQDEPATTVVAPVSPEPELRPDNQANMATPEVEAPPEDDAVPQPEEQPGNPPGPDFYTELDKAFTALSNDDFVAFKQYRMGVKKLASDQRLDATIVDANLKSLDEIGSSYQAVCQLVQAAILKLIRKKTFAVPGDRKYRVVTAVADRLRVEFLVDGKRVKENYPRKPGSPPVYENMPTSLATYLAKQAIKRRLLKDELDLELAARGADFFRDLDFDQLPAESRTRWSVVEEQWLSTAAGN